MTARRFWMIDTLWGRSGDASDTWFVDNGGEMNTLLYRLLPAEDDWHFGPISRWDGDAMLKCERTKAYKDIVGVGIREAVSDRVKAIIEEVAPDHAQFLPVTMVWRRSILPLNQYWIVNWNRQVDCWDRRAGARAAVKTVRKYNPELTEREVKAAARDWPEFVLDATKIPDGWEAFYLKGSNYEVISDRLKRALMKAKVTGCGFGGVPVENGPRKPATPRRYITKFDAPATLKPANNLKTRLASLKIKRLGPRDFVRAVVGDDVTVEVGKGADADAVKMLERRLKLKLPENYRKFLASCGSAVIEGVEIIGIPSRKSDPAAAEVTESMRKAKIFDWPAHLLCIAEDGRGGYYCLDTSKTRGADCPVVYFDHELATEDGATGRFKPRLEKVKPSFKSWLKEISRTGEPGPY